MLFRFINIGKNGHSILTSNEITVDSGWINGDLLVKYNAHINVEVCNKTKSVKYLFKYINKEHDRATVVIEGNVIDKEKETIITMKLNDTSIVDMFQRLRHAGVYLNLRCNIINCPYKDYFFISPESIQ